MTSLRLRLQFAQLLSILGFAIALIPSLTLAQDSAGQEKKAKYEPPVIDAISAAMEKHVESGEIAGAVTLVAHEGKIVHLGAVGLADLETAKKMRAYNMFSIASMTKPIVATAVGILAEEGKLSFDDEVKKYLPELADLKLKSGESPARAMTIRDAITHTSGLGGSQRFEGSLKDGIDELAKRPLLFSPGEQWKYSPGLNVCGRIVEVVSGQRLDDFLQERIFAPLEMKNTSFYPDAKQRRKIATLYAPSEDGKSLVSVPNRISDIEVGDKSQGPNPSGGLFATARDMFRFYQMILNGGKFRKKQILNAEIVSQMTSPQTGDLKTGFTPGNCWGLGWCIVREPQGVTEKLSSGTFGHGGAFGTQGWVDPKTKTIFVLMIQRTKLPNSDGSEIRKDFHAAAVSSLDH